MLSPIGRYKTGPASHLARHIIEAHGDDKLKSADKLNRLTTSLLMQWKKGLT